MVARMFLSIVLVIAPVAFAQDLLWRPTIILDEAEHTKIFEEANKCGAYTGAHPIIVKNFLSFKLRADDKTKEFLYCVFTALRYANEDGHLNQNFILLYKNRRFEKDVQHIFNKCRSQNKYNFLETLYQEVDCFFTKTPVTIGQFTEDRVWQEYIE